MASAADQDFTRVIEAAASGDEVAFARIVAAHEAEMYRICVVVSHDRAIAADAVQAAWAIAWRKLGSIREPARLRRWLIRVAVNEAHQMLRKRRRRGNIEFRTDATEEPGGVDPATGIDSLDLDEALQRLDPDDRALLAMRYVAGFDATELAAAIGLTPSGTRTRLERLLARLRRELE